MKLGSSKLIMFPLCISGDLEVIMANYDRQKEEYNKELETNRAKQQADLQMKLQARRSRKRRMMAQQQELNVRS